MINQYNLYPMNLNNRETENVKESILEDLFNISKGLNHGTETRLIKL